MLLERLGLPFVAVSPDVDERPTSGETPAALCARLAAAKAHALVARYPAHIVIGSDQVAERDGVSVGKPASFADAAAQLAAASGRTVLFHTAVYVLDSASGRHGAVVVPTSVTFRDLPPATIADYLAREPALDCAGSFKAEGLGIALCARIASDDPTALIGLPLIALTELLAAVGAAPLASHLPGA
jgi:septum formation protein